MDVMEALKNLREERQLIDTVIKILESIAMKRAGETKPKPVRKVAKKKR